MKAQKSKGTGLCEKCRSCIIYYKSCNLSSRVSVRVALCTVIDHAVNPETRDFTAQMPWEHRIQMKRYYSWVFSGCGNVSTRRGALPLLDALWLFHPSWAVVTETAVICGCPWPIRASFCWTRWAFSFSLFFSLPLCCRGNWGKFGLFFVLEGVWNQPACSAFTVPCRPVRGAKVVVAGPFWDADN